MVQVDTGSQATGAAKDDTAADGVQIAGRSQYAIARQLAADWQTQLINPVARLPDQKLIRRYGAAACLNNKMMPWRQVGGATIILTPSPTLFARHQADLQAIFGPLRIAITTQDQLDRSITDQYATELVSRAETRAPERESCRNWNNDTAIAAGLAGIAGVVVLGVIAPRGILAALTGWAVLVLVLNTMLRAVAGYLGWRGAPSLPQVATPVRLPVISVLVPLYQETAITDHLLTRLRALDYPRDRLDICLVLEADDQTTRATLGQTTLPTWMRAIVVPKGTIRTKPRALNYALDFAHGSIIGVWDAEDAPAKDQLRKVAHHFANSGPQVACVQGILDYYNASTNWLTRCFAIEYASWFRVILPGLARMGLVVPLGGTTLFFRRHVLEELGGWDAHNVTEDADLGVRLARHGYRTALIPTVTEEEANGRVWPWIKQRSRWLKGYAITYAVHMRNPARLWRDLGAWRFFGLQLLFLGTLSQFVLAPVFWTFWLLPFGFDHPLRAIISGWAFWTIVGVFISSEIAGFAVSALALRKAGKAKLMIWAVTLQFYFPLAALAAYKGIFELATKPFYWDKTAHGVLLPAEWPSSKATLPPRPPAHPVSDA
ncbi:glycosyltransferase [Yoonia sp.]|uniref:glycosyltransferase n=1 Tax=Yoonia sp. TaxID=2212373 RepID=UPI001A009A03|nr:glycosyltransferase [Yoonia sp.]MBE0414178.1 glycosyltransferase [Yoonia sp.]